MAGTGEAGGSDGLGRFWGARYTRTWFTTLAGLPCSPPSVSRCSVAPARGWYCYRCWWWS